MTSKLAVSAVCVKSQAHHRAAVQNEFVTNVCPKGRVADAQDTSVWLIEQTMIRHTQENDTTVAGMRGSAYVHIMINKQFVVK